MLAIGNNELAKQPPVKKVVKCWKCGKNHRVTYGEEVLRDGTRIPYTLLAFMKCGKTTYLCGVNGKQWRPRNARQS